MKNDLSHGNPLFERLIKSNMSFAELMIAADAMYNHYFDIERRTVMVEALRCDQVVLAIIGDFMIQIDTVFLSIAYTDTAGGYYISLRTCHEKLQANEIAAYLCEGIGNGGGHRNKAGGRIVKMKMKEVYGTENIFTVINERLIQYMEKEKIQFDNEI